MGREISKSIHYFRLYPFLCSPTVTSRNWNRFSYSSSIDFHFAYGNFHTQSFNCCCCCCSEQMRLTKNIHNPFCTYALALIDIFNAQNVTDNISHWISAHDSLKFLHTNTQIHNRILLFAQKHSNVHSRVKKLNSNTRTDRSPLQSSEQGTMYVYLFHLTCASIFLMFFLLLYSFSFFLLPFAYRIVISWCFCGCRCCRRCRHFCVWFINLLNRHSLPGRMFDGSFFPSRRILIDFFVVCFFVLVRTQNCTLYFWCTTKNHLFSRFVDNDWFFDCEKINFSV